MGYERSGPRHDGSGLDGSRRSWWTWTAMAAQYIHADELSVVIARQLRGLSDGWRTRRWTHGSHGSLGYGAGHERRRWTRRNEEFAGQRWTGNTSRGCRRQWRNG